MVPQCSWAKVRDAGSLICIQVDEIEYRKSIVQRSYFFGVMINVVMSYMFIGECRFLVRLEYD